jgi:hypothetical protein
MITQKPECFEVPMSAADRAAHDAWRESWKLDDKIMAHTPPGYWFDLVNIARVKRLLKCEMPDDVRLRFLEYLNGTVDGLLTEEAMRLVEPACDVAEEMMRKMDNLHLIDKCQVMRKWNVMASFCNLNPSLIEAMKLFQGAALYVKAAAA